MIWIILGLLLIDLFLYALIANNKRNNNDDEEQMKAIEEWRKKNG